MFEKQDEPEFHDRNLHFGYCFIRKLIDTNGNTTLELLANSGPNTWIYAWPDCRAPSSRLEIWIDPSVVVRPRGLRRLSNGFQEWSDLYESFNRTVFYWASIELHNNKVQPILIHAIFCHTPSNRPLYGDYQPRIRSACSGVCQHDRNSTWPQLFDTTKQKRSKSRVCNAHVLE